jgi:CBS domain-containing protein
VSKERQYPPVLVRDLMTVGVFTCPMDTLLVDLAKVLVENGFEGSVVLDNEGHAVGVVTQTEIVKAYSQGDYQDKTVEEIMNPNVPQVPPDIPLSVAAQIMQDHGVRILYMMHHAGGIEYPAAMLTYKHFLRHLISKEEADLQDLGVGAERENPLEQFIKKRDQARKKNLTG